MELDFDPSDFDLPALLAFEEWDSMQPAPDPLLGHDLISTPPTLNDPSQLLAISTQGPGPGPDPSLLHAPDRVPSDNLSMTLAANENLDDRIKLLDIDIERIDLLIRRRLRDRGLSESNVHEDDEAFSLMLRKNDLRRGWQELVMQGRARVGQLMPSSGVSRGLGAVPETYLDFQTGLSDSFAWNSLPMSIGNEASALPNTTVSSIPPYSPLEFANANWVASNHSLIRVPPQSPLRVTNEQPASIFSNDSAQFQEPGKDKTSHSQFSLISNTVEVSRTASQQPDISGKVVQMQEPSKAIKTLLIKRKRSFTEQLEGGFHMSCYAFGGSQDINKRRKWTQTRKQNTKDVNAAGGACFRCRLKKLPCSGTRPCDSCRKFLERSKIWTLGFDYVCTVRFRLSDILESRSLGPHFPICGHKHSSSIDHSHCLELTAMHRLEEMFAIISLACFAETAPFSGSFAECVDPLPILQRVFSLSHISGVVAHRVVYGLEENSATFGEAVIHSILVNTVETLKIADSLIDLLFRRTAPNIVATLRQLFPPLMIGLQLHLYPIINLLRSKDQPSDLLSKIEHVRGAIAARFETICSSCPYIAQFRKPWSSTLKLMDTMKSDKFLYATICFSREEVDANVAEADIEFLLSGLKCNSDGVYELPGLSKPRRMEKNVVRSIFLTHYLSIASNIEEDLLNQLGISRRLVLRELRRQSQVTMNHFDAHLHISITSNYYLLHAESILSPKYSHVLSDYVAVFFNGFARFLFDRYKAKTIVSREVDRTIIFNLAYTLALELFLCEKPQLESGGASSFRKDFLPSAVFELDSLLEYLPPLSDEIREHTICDSTCSAKQVSWRYRLGPQHKGDSITELVSVTNDDDGSECRTTLHRGPCHLHPENHPCQSPKKCIVCFLRKWRPSSKTSISWCMAWSPGYKGDPLRG
ncbi:uncharacterized protein A1O5_08198 [Cladophialophora psammophila CBS 110553]|uniref:Zn(2)-C6 fungal-type domain-containing protein n=1 Tax=Cladophialophora psammophila CBS 110553 TaxID=1182543 RepID=W9WUV7_9EURO|nr:uncharacterized protein A1O5_08198 [Cladophialophora psammophila CBS 110553]EXJ68406.1 hypothetical protein A1O5_08198 [Cladophialophora psammophila CBS 110553]